MTYAFDTKEKYYEDIGVSEFAVTMKKRWLGFYAALQNRGKRHSALFL